jgi:hypothetical protein
MKTKIAIALVASAGILELTGCKPKETTLSGQMFIVTQGAENVKLGDVEILLIEKSQATDFLQKKQPAIKSEMALKQQELTNAEQEVVTASGNAGKAQAYFDWFTVNKPYKTNADYAKIKSQWNILFNQYGYQTNYVERLYAYTTNNLYDENAENNFRAAVNRREEIAVKLNSLNDELEAIKSAAIATETERLEAVKSSVARANADAAIANTNLEKSPSLADYFGDFSPVIVQKTISDSDGKFSFVYPHDKSFTIFSSAQRMVLNKTEKYFWLVNAPTNAESVQIFLSNNNLVEVDPDGYFDLKPKAEVQKSPDVNAQ